MTVPEVIIWATVQSVVSLMFAFIAYRAGYWVAYEEMTNGGGQA